MYMLFPPTPNLWPGPVTVLCPLRVHPREAWGLTVVTVCVPTFTVRLAFNVYTPSSPPYGYTERLARRLYGKGKPRRHRSVSALTPTRRSGFRKLGEVGGHRSAGGSEEGGGEGEGAGGEGGAARISGGAAAGLPFTAH
eukprot:783502-Pyramimonas_sp.AAC.1